MEWNIAEGESLQAWLAGFIKKSPAPCLLLSSATFLSSGFIGRHPLSTWHSWVVLSWSFISMATQHSVLRTSPINSHANYCYIWHLLSLSNVSPCRSNHSPCSYGSQEAGLQELHVNTTERPLNPTTTSETITVFKGMIFLIGQLGSCARL